MPIKIGIFFFKSMNCKIWIKLLPAWKKLTRSILLRICKFLTEIWCQKPNLLSEIQIGVLSFLPVLHGYFSLIMTSLLELELAELNVNSYCDFILLIWIWFDLLSSPENIKNQAFNTLIKHIFINKKLFLSLVKWQMNGVKYYS